VEPSGYAGGASTRHEDITRFNPTVVIVDVQGGEPNDSTTFSVAHGSRSYPSSVTWTPDSAGVYVTQESAGLVVALSRTGSAKVMAANRGARGIAWVDGEPVSHGFLDHNLSWVTRDEGTTVSITNESLSDDVAAGQILFYTSGGVMSADGSGLSCSTCHFEGRNDGQTWNLDNGPRQTMTLAGKISGTEPISWTNDVASVQHEAQATSETRMGGSGLHDRDADRIAAYIDFTPNPDLPAQDPASVLRGKEIFERADVACAECHNGSSYTDNLTHTMFGLDNVNTPTLTGIASTAPYLHDGRYQTLGALLQSLEGEMGDTSMLSGEELTDLEAYLKSL
jgi:cytochrome c553